MEGERPTFVPCPGPDYVTHWLYCYAKREIHVQSEEFLNTFSSDQLVAQSYLTLCTPGFPVHHQLLEFTQTHIHRVSDAIQPSHPVSSPSPPAFNLSQNYGLF